MGQGAAVGREDDCSRRVWTASCSLICPQDLAAVLADSGTDGDCRLRAEVPVAYDKLARLAGAKPGLDWCATDRRALG